MSSSLFALAASGAGGMLAVQPERTLKLSKAGGSRSPMGLAVGPVVAITVVVWRIASALVDRLGLLRFPQ